jgi:hypothetical protein
VLFFVVTLDIFTCMGEKNDWSMLISFRACVSAHTILSVPIAISHFPCWPFAVGRGFYLCCLVQLHRLMDYFAVLNHKATSQVLNYKPAKLANNHCKSHPLTRRCAYHVQTKALCGSGKGQPGPRGVLSNSKKHQRTPDAKTGTDHQRGERRSRKLRAGKHMSNSQPIILRSSLKRRVYYG